MPDLRGIEDDVRFAWGAAESLAAHLRSCASVCTSGVSHRHALAQHALSEWRGAFAGQFQDRMRICRADADRLAASMRTAATNLDELSRLAREEQDRREKARAWKDHQDHQGFLENIWEGITGDNDTPPPAPAAVPPHFVSQAPVAASGVTRAMPGHSGGGATAVSSARPDHLQAFAVHGSETDEEFGKHLAGLRSRYEAFTEGSSWGHFDITSLVNGCAWFLGANGLDEEWVAQIAAAFRAAGGSGTLSSLPNAAIEMSLRSAGLLGTRTPITFNDASAWGFPPTTGYADDPINTASGNFVTSHTDLAVDSLAAGLSFSRVYNSRSDAVGAFGPGWSSWADARLVARPDGAYLDAPDGQRVLFPRAGAGYGRVPAVRGLVEVRTDGLTLRWFGGEQWDFDGAGRPVRRHSGPGTSIRFAHDHEGRLIALTHESGTTVRVGWTGSRISDLTTSDGRVTSYRYDDAGQLVESDGATGLSRFGLDDAGRVVSIADADGVVHVVNTYDQHGRVQEQISNFGRRSYFRYLPGRVTVTGDDAGGPSNTYVHDTGGRLLAVIDGHGQRLSLTYDHWGNPVTATERNGAVTVQQWDERARLVRRVLPSGAEFTFRYDDADRVLEVAASSGGVTRYRYEGDERQPAEIIDPEGGVTHLSVSGGLVHQVIDPDGVRLRFEYDAHGRMAAATDADGNTARLERDDAGRVTAAVTPLGRRTRFSYDQRGLLTERVEPSGAVWRFGYTAAGRPAQTIDPYGALQETRYGEHGSATVSIDQLGHETSTRYDTFGNQVSVVAADGAKWDFGYDALSRLTSIADPAGSSWLREYDVNGNLIGSIDPAGTHNRATVDRAGRVTGLDDGLTSVMFELDGLGRSLVHRRPDGTQARTGYDLCGRSTWFQGPDGGITRIEYTAGGKVRRIVKPSGAADSWEYDACGRLAAHEDAAGRRWEHRYDADGALVARIGPDAEAQRFSYDAAGRLIRRSAPGQGAQIYTYDRSGRITSVTGRVGGRRRFRYDGAGRLITAIDALGGVTRFGYNARNWLVSITDPIGGTAHRHYDEVGRLVREIDPLGRVTSLTYDAAGRLIERTDPTGIRMRWSYDVSGRVSTYGPAGGEPTRIGRDALGRAVQVHEPGSFTHRLRWDAAGRLIERHRDDLAVGWSYDSDGRRTAMSYPDGTQMTYVYDGGGLITSVQHPAMGKVEFRRDRSGRLIRLTGHGVRRTWTYQNGDLAACTREGGGERRETRLERDAWGRVIAAGFGDQRSTYTYDAAGQLVSAKSAAGSFAFGYDANGRMIWERSPAGTSEYDYDAAAQLVSRTAESGTTRFAYDAAGRRVSETSPTSECRYDWDASGRLGSVTRVDSSTAGTPAEQTTRIRVDALGELAELSGAPLMWDTADPLGPVCSIGDQLVVGLGEPWLTAESGSGAAEASWISHDWQGSTARGRDPWGARAATAEPRIGYRGEIEFDGLTWLRNRVYQAGSRAFLSPDPLAPVPGTAYSGNPYHYAGNNPILLSDPLGLRPVTDMQLQFYRDHMNQGLVHGITEWFTDNWELLAAGAMVVAGVALLCTGVGGPAGIALMAASGGLLSGGFSVAAQKSSSGHVDWNRVLIDGAVGAVSGVAGGAAGALAVKSTLLAGAPAMARTIVSGQVASTASGMVGRGMTGGNPFDPIAMQGDLAVGAGTGAVGGALGGFTSRASPVTGDFRALSGDVEGHIQAWRFHDASDPVTLQSRLVHADMNSRQGVLNSLSTPGAVLVMADHHMSGSVANSPFVSLTTNPAAAANSSDPWLRAITSGGASYGGVVPAPHLSEFSVPRSKIIEPLPSNSLSLQEGEVVYFGDDLKNYLVQTINNPFLPGP